MTAGIREAAVRPGLRAVRHFGGPAPSPSPRDAAPRLVLDLPDCGENAAVDFERRIGSIGVCSRDDDVVERCSLFESQDLPDLMTAPGRPRDLATENTDEHDAPTLASNCEPAASVAVGGATAAATPSPFLVSTLEVRGLLDKQGDPHRLWIDGEWCLTAVDLVGR